MPDAREELTLRPRAPASAAGWAGLLTLLLALALPCPGSAQEAGDVRALLEAGPGPTRIHGETTLLFDFALGLQLVASSVVVGGAGHLLTSSVSLGEIGFQEVELELGYGGLFGRVERRAPFRRATWSGEVLLGAGNADVRDRATGLHLDSDNFLVFQPAAGLYYAVRGPFRIGASVSYRVVTGVEDLRGVDSGDLRSLSLHLRLRLAPL